MLPGLANYSCSQCTVLMCSPMLLLILRRRYICTLAFGIVDQGSLIPFLPLTALLTTVFKKHENIKHHAYGQHVCEIESFTLIVLSATGSWFTKPINFYKHLASFSSTIWGEVVLDWLCCCLGFSMFHTVHL